MAAGIPMEIYSLDRALKSAIDNNAAIQNAEQDIIIAEQRVTEAKLRFLPEVGVQASATRYNARFPFALRPRYRSLLLFPSDQDNLFSGQAYLTLPLYEGRRNINTFRLAQTALKQARAKYDTVQLDIVYKTKKVFYRYLLEEKLLEASEKLARIIEKAGKRADADPWGKLEAETIESQFRSQQDEIRHALELAHLDFLKGLNIELDRPVRIEGEFSSSPIDVDLRMALVWATELRPEMQAQTLRAQMDAIGVNLALSRRYPTLALGVDYEITGQEFPLRQNNWAATFGIRLPFAFDFWPQHTRKLSEQRQAEIKRAELKDQVHLEVRKAHRDLLYWQTEWSTREKEYARLKRLLNLAENKSMGRPSTAMRAAAGVLAAHKRYLTALTEHLLARARLERAVGRPFPGSP